MSKESQMFYSININNYIQNIIELKNKYKIHFVLNIFIYI